MTTRTTLLTASLLLAAAALCALALASAAAAASETKGGHYHGSVVGGRTTKAEGPNSAGDGPVGDHARTDKALKDKLLKASEGVQYPGSESDSTWQFVSYPNEKELPDADRFQQISSCPVTEQGSTSRQDFGDTMGRLTKIEPWMDEGQKESARGFKKIERIMLHSYDDQAVYRCDTGQYGQVYLYFVGVVNEEGISGLLTVSTET